MSRIKIQTDFVKSTGAGLAPDSVKLSDSKDGLSSLRYAIDHKIIAKGNLRARMDGAVQALGSLQTRVRELERFIEHSADEYNRVESDLTKKSFEAITPKKKSDPALANILEYFSNINSGLSQGDLALIATQLFSVATTGVLSRKLKINYIDGKPKFFQKLFRQYKFTVQADPTWTSRGRYSSKIARMIYDFSKSNPTNPLVKMIHKYVQSYSSPSALLKHIAGFPKNVNSAMKASNFSKVFKNRITIGTKEVAETVLKERGLTAAAKRVPLVGTGISFAANAYEIWDPKNSGKSLTEKTGRALAGVGADFGAITAGAEAGAAIGSIFGPVGIVVGGATGGVVGAWASGHYEDQIKDFGEDVAVDVTNGVKTVADKVSKGFKSIKSWFN